MKGRRPNILIFMVDQLNGTLFPDGPAEFLHTPYLRALAERSVRFQNAYCASPLCVPARAALATGRHPHESGFWESSMAFDGSIDSWMGRLRDHGHETVGIGKMHFRRDEDDYGYAYTDETMHIAEGVGDVISALRRQRGISRINFGPILARA